MFTKHYIYENKGIPKETGEFSFSGIGILYEKPDNLFCRKKSNHHWECRIKTFQHYDSLQCSGTKKTSQWTISPLLKANFLGRMWIPNLVCFRRVTERLAQQGNPFWPCICTIGCYWLVLKSEGLCVLYGNWIRATTIKDKKSWFDYNFQIVPLIIMLTNWCLLSINIEEWSHQIPTTTFVY